MCRNTFGIKYLVPNARLTKYFILEIRLIHFHKLVAMLSLQYMDMHIWLSQFLSIRHTHCCLRLHFLF